jgi:hypothetical protein
MYFNNSHLFGFAQYLPGMACGANAKQDRKKAHGYKDRVFVLAHSLPSLCRSYAMTWR